jgi:uncharacterized protein YlbG (UPF0298 family)
VNLGGQLVSEKEVDRLRRDIGSGKLSSWDSIHGRYDELWGSYKIEKQRHAYATLCLLYETDTLNQEIWDAALTRSLAIQEYVSDQVYHSRKKDYENPFRIMIYRNKEEMKATMGDIESNDFILQVREETAAYIKLIQG